MSTNLRALAPALAVASAVALGACGAAGGVGGTSTGSGNAASVSFAQCMRAHGVPQFPDPLPGGGFARGSVDRQAPAFQRAQTDCIHILKAGSSHPRPTTAQRAAALRYARCMRAHGVPSFPDPVTTVASPTADVIEQGGLMFPVGSSIDPSSPTFEHADALCGQARGGTPKGG